MAGGPKLFTVPPDVPFVDALARSLLRETASARADGDPLALARYTVLLPTRRACRGLAEAFLRAHDGAALLLPRLRPIGDVDEDDLALTPSAAFGGANDPLDLPPAMSPTRRLLLLARLILAAHRTPEGAAPDADQAVWLAHELARLLDQVQTEELSFDGLAGLAPDHLAEHWQSTLDFLRIVTENWPNILAEEKAMDPASRRNALLDAQAEIWRNSPPDDPIIAAGSTGSIPASARLLATIAGLPNGRVIVPGLDHDMVEECWQALDAGHPQYGLKQLLERLEMGREHVVVWPGVGPERPTPQTQAAAIRGRLIAEAMRPAATTDAWRDMAVRPESAEQGMQYVERIDCPTPREEAGVIALILRDVLEEPEKTAALVTLDRGLARQVAAELGRWGVDIDDSAGQPLAATPPGSFLRLTARMIADNFAPVPLLAVGKHPLAAGGMAPGDFRRKLRRLEMAVLRGPRPAPGLDGLRRALAALDPRRRKKLGGTGEADTIVAALETAAGDVADVFARPRVSLRALLAAHLRFAEALAASDTEPGPARLWAGDAGEQAARLAAALLDEASAFPELSSPEYPGLLDALMAGAVVRPRYGRHPRLAIWGPLEARLQHADLIVLGGLNEGNWPREIEADPWMSRQMRAAFGLPAAERRIGLSAHDFAQAFCAGEVVLTRAGRDDGAPTVASRWLMRLDAVLRGLGLLDGAANLRWKTRGWLHWHRQLDAAENVAPVKPPMPMPPVTARPRELSVTQVEKWMCNPYAVYAQHILGLQALEPIDADPGAADYGTLMHHTLDRFLREAPDVRAEDALERLIAIGGDVFDVEDAHPGVAAFWWPRFCRVAAWFVETERARRASLAASASEVRGRLEIAAPAGPFILKATADRIDRLATGGLAVIDYKTGAVPTMKAVAAGYAPQLPLEAAIARANGFADIDAGPVQDLSYWRLAGGAPAGEIKAAVRGDPEILAQAAIDGLRELIARFDNPATPYLAVPDPRHPPRYDDYAHLARIKEWAAGDAEGDQ